MQLRTVVVAACLAGAPLLFAEGLKGSWTWADLRSVAGADATEAAWIAEHVELTEARRLVDLIRRLSRPEAASLMAAYPHLDGTASQLTEAERARLAARPPAGEPGVVHVLFTVTRTRADLIARREARMPGLFRDRFGDAPVMVAAPRPAAPEGRVRVTFDFEPARRLLGLLEAGEQDPVRIRESLASTVTDALLTHRSQSFYPLALSWEMLAANVALAGSPEPLPQLYAEANPGAFYDLGDVRRNLERYRGLIAALERDRDALALRVLDRLAPLLPADAVLARRVSFLFAAGADGWAANGVAAIDLQFFKDDVEAMLRLVTHETCHAVQAELAVAAPALPEGPAADALGVLFREGTATWVAPPQELSAEQRQQRVDAGVRLLHTVAAGPAHEADAAVQEGVSGAGPFYWLGAAMAQAIADVDGAGAVAATLGGGPRAFAEAYARAAGRHPRPPVGIAEITALAAPR